MQRIQAWIDNPGVENGEWPSIFSMNGDSFASIENRLLGSKVFLKKLAIFFITQDDKVFDKIVKD